MDNDRLHKAAESILGEPFLLDLSENDLKVRKNLILAGIVSIATSVLHLKIDAKQSFLGIQLSGLQEWHVKAFLITVVFYLLIHYLWIVVENFGKWRLRLTGTALLFGVSNMNKTQSRDYPANPRQSTLYSWWNERAHDFDPYFSQVDIFNDHIDRLRQIMATIDVDPTSLNDEATRLKVEIDGARLGGVDANMHLTQALQFFRDQRPSVSLYRFDNWFKYVQYSQNLKWVLLDVVFPMGVGVVAMFCYVGFFEAASNAGHDICVAVSERSCW